MTIQFLPCARQLPQRTLNRATLARQCLLERVARPVPEIVERLGGLQAQTTHSWYVGLWTRLDPYDPDETGRLLTERRLVRIALMRSTIHLVTAEDCLWLRPLLAPAIEKPMSNYGRNLVDLDRAAVAAAARELVDEHPLTATELGKRLAEHWPERDPATLAMVARVRLAFVQVTPRGVWGASGQAAHTTAEAWLGQPLAADSSPDALVLRYLAAFGPASVMDAQAWCGLTRLGEAFERLRPQLITFASEDGRELFDLPDAPRPDPDTPAPVRFLYEYDNLLLSHADRSRFFLDERCPDMWRNQPAIPGAVLVDGAVRATWSVTREKGAATLNVLTAMRLPKADTQAVREEGERLLAFLAPRSAQRRVTIARG